MIDENQILIDKNLIIKQKYLFEERKKIYSIYYYCYKNLKL
jgi:hypothetical protein